MNDEMILAGGRVPKRASDLIGKTHREAYPEQYNDPAVGKYVVHDGDESVQGTINRVVHTQWGILAYIDGQDPKTAWLLTDLRVTENPNV